MARPCEVHISIPALRTGRWYRRKDTATVSRVEHLTTTRRRVLAGLAPTVLGLGLAAVLTGCGAGQITQTDLQSAAVNGASGTVGAMAVRNAQLAYPDNQDGTYAPGSTAELVVTIINTGQTDDQLVKITSPAAGSVTIDGAQAGSKAIPGGFAVQSGQDVDDSDAAVSTPPTAEAPSSNPPSSASGEPSLSPSSDSPIESRPSVPGSVATATPPAKVTIELVGIKSVNGASLRAGLTIPITFYFQHAGQVTINAVPIGAPSDKQVSSSS
jgi:copper(I)-binding protein